MAEEKKAFQLPKTHVGYISKSKAGNSMITIEQDMVLKKGDKLSIKKPSEAIEGLLQRGFITEEQAEERIARIPEWKLSEVTLMKFDK